MIKDIRALLDNMQEAMHCLAMHSGTQEFMRHESRSKTYISDDQLLAMEHCIYHGFRAMLRVCMVNAYLRWVGKPEARAGMEGMDGTTGCG
jgi:hypothetical protein